MRSGPEKVDEEDDVAVECVGAAPGRKSAVCLEEDDKQDETTMEFVGTAPGCMGAARTGVLKCMRGGMDLKTSRTLRLVVECASDPACAMCVDILQTMAMCDVCDCVH